MMVIITTTVVAFIIFCIWRYIQNYDVTKDVTKINDGADQVTSDTSPEWNGVEDVKETNVKDPLNDAGENQSFSSTGYSTIHKLEQERIKKTKSAPQLREEGNHFYRRASQAGLSPVLKKARLKEALQHYKASLSCSTSDDEKSSAYKNIALTHKKYALVLCECDSSKEYRDSFLLAMKNFVFALGRSSSKDILWVENVKEHLSDTIKGAIADVLDKESDCKSKVPPLQSYLFAVKHTDSSIILLKILIPLEFQIGEEYFHTNSYTLCLQQMNECRRLLNDLQLLSEDFDPEYIILLEDIQCFERISESINHRVTGDCIFQTLTKQNAPRTKSSYESVITEYRKAAECAKTYNIIAEAFALSRLGKMYDILNDKPQATSYFKRCLDIVKETDNKKYINEEWYQYCEVCLQRYRDSVIVQDSDRWKDIRKQYLEEVKQQILELGDTSRNNHLGFLRSLYNKYPPKNLSNNISDENFTSKNLRKLYRNARVHYHPDKVDVKLHGDKWKVFCEQISCLLNDIVNSIT